MFRASSAQLQEVNNVNCPCMQPLVFSAGGRLLHLQRGDYDTRPTKSQDSKNIVSNTSHEESPRSYLPHSYIIMEFKADILYVNKIRNFQSNFFC